MFAIASLIFISSANIVVATTEVETKEALMNYIRVLFSDKQVIDTYQRLVAEGYSWQDEHANFGSMIDEKHESFHGQVQIVMKRIKDAKRKTGERRVLVIDFLWSRIGNTIENIKAEAY